MGRKKKVIEEVKFEPSHYQKAIYDFVQHDVGNLVVEAAAGAGKTSTLLQILKLLPKDKKVLFCAFNKDIVKEIEKKVDKELTNVDIRTVHSLGFLMIQRNFKDTEIVPNENKYRQFIINNLDTISSIDITYLKYKEKMKYIDNICELTNFARFNLANSIKEIEKLVERYDIDIFADEIEATLEVLKWGQEYINEIDFTDMIWLPYVLHLKPIGLLYDYILGDECQDFSTAQRELLLRCRKINTRMFCFGDKNQAIYGFSSADPESFDTLKSLPNTKSLPLSISYRCAKNIVRFAQNIVETIEHNEANNNEGEVKYNVSLEDVQDGDMVLCRNNAPLMKIYSDFIRMGKKCQIKGKDIGTNLKRLVKSMHQEELNVSLENDGLFIRLYDSLFEMRNKIIKQTNLDVKTVMNDSKIVNKLDMIRALEVLSEGLNTSDELIERISGMFSDKKINGISLSTIHKAKGLEANNVFIACPSLMPCKSATLDWEILQEKNLQYVAYTRAKNKLCFIDESEFKTFTDNTNDNLKSIEQQVNLVLGKTNKLLKNEIINPTYFISRTKTFVKPTIGTSKVLGQKPISSAETSNMNGLLMKNKKRIKRM